MPVRKCKSGFLFMAVLLATFLLVITVSGENPATQSSAKKDDIKEVESILKKLSTEPPITPMKFPGKIRATTKQSARFSYIDKEYTPLFSPIGKTRQKLLPEGYYISNRRGRLVKGSNVWMFVFESQSKSSTDSPIILLPNRWLEKMEADVLATPEPIVFKVSGEVTVYHGKNYLLLRKVLIERRFEKHE